MRLHWQALGGLLGVGVLSVGLCFGAEPAAEKTAAQKTTSGSRVTGDYLESRTCDVYTGPCFANAEIGLSGREAVLAWSIDQGSFQGVDLSGLKVVLAVKASDTLAYGGGLVSNPDPIRSVAMVDARATVEQQAALLAFAQHAAGKVAGKVVKVSPQTITMTVDHVDHAAVLRVGKTVEIRTRMMARGDCVCTNESIFYPPLTKVENAFPAYNLAHKFTAQGLGGTWSNPNTRSAFIATFTH